MNFAGKGLTYRRSKTLRFRRYAFYGMPGGEDCKGIAFWRHPQSCGGRRCKAIPANLSGKRTENVFHIRDFSLLSFNFWHLQEIDEYLHRTKRQAFRKACLFFSFYSARFIPLAMFVLLLSACSCAHIQAHSICSHQNIY